MRKNATLWEKIKVPLITATAIGALAGGLALSNHISVSKNKKAAAKAEEAKTVTSRLKASGASESNPTAGLK